MIVSPGFMPPHGRYRIARKIADGGMAEIFLATQHGAEGFERKVVLKRIMAVLLTDPKFRNMMIDEAHVAMSLNHSNIAQVLDLGQARGRYFLVLELVDGWDLNHILHREKAVDLAMPPELRLYVVAEICRALAYAHARTRDGRPLGIVHRDVSPHNVLVSEQGEVKLTDFGIAKAMGRRERTGQGIIKGKLAFMSPEQASGAALDARSDLFSIGTILYLMFTNRRPFEAPTDLEVVLRVQQGKFQAAAEVAPELDARLAAIIEKAMRHDPADRYQTAEDLLVDLEAVQRTVYRPAGQTELKRWLAELGRRDGIPSISRAPGKPADADNEEIDFLEGEDLIFEDVSREVSRVAAPTPVALPPPVPAGLRNTVPTPVVDGPSGATLMDRPAAGPATPRDEMPARRSTRRLLGRLVLAGGIAGGGIWLWPRLSHLSRPGGRGPGPESSPERLPVATSPLAPQVAAPALPRDSGVPNQAQEPSPGDAGGDLSTGMDGGRDGARDDGADAIPGGDDPAAARPSDEDDEESLLRRSEPDLASKVFDERDSPSPPARATPAAISPKAAPPTAPPPVSVKVQSRPEGAVIKMKQRVFGRAPMNLRFAPGITYELTFVRQGYQPTTKRFTVSRRKNQVVTAVLAKKASRPAKPKGLLQRWFGR
jgi:serine/threonine-protein kinase